MRNVMVNGVMIYEDRQFSFDCGPIFREAQKVAKKCGREWMRSLHSPCKMLNRPDKPVFFADSAREMTRQLTRRRAQRL